MNCEQLALASRSNLLRWATLLIVGWQQVLHGFRELLRLRHCVVSTHRLA